MLEYLPINPSNPVDDVVLSLALPYFPVPVVILTDEFFNVSARLYLVLPFLSSESSTITLPLESNPLATI